jgi:quercetin dioxygenase-like cupin family protein
MSDEQSVEFDPAFYEIPDLPAFSPVDGITMRAIIGGKLMANWVRLSPNTVMPEHDHPHEQLGYILEGSMELTVGGETRNLTPGVAYTIPGGVRHGATAGPDGCLVMDIFTPPREEYAELARQGK